MNTTRLARFPVALIAVTLFSLARVTPAHACCGAGFFILPPFTVLATFVAGAMVVCGALYAPIAVLSALVGPRDTLRALEEELSVYPTLAGGVLGVFLTALLVDFLLAFGAVALIGGNF